MSDLKYKNTILDFSLLLNNAQKPIQILDAIKWSEDIESFIIKTNFKEMPKIDYRDRPLKYDPIKKLQEFKELRLKITRELGPSDPLAAILIRNCSQYEDVVKMLQNRGKSEFYDYSKKLYGSPTEIMDDGKSKLSDVANAIHSLLVSLDKPVTDQIYEKNMSAEEVVDQLKIRLEKYFEGDCIKIKLSDGIISDASAGADYIKIKNGMMFSKRDLDVFEVHEGWVHLGTTFNGNHQPFAKWLAKGPPCSTITQEGLAVTMELLNFSLFPKRAKRLNSRLLACQMVEDGANLLELIEFFRERGEVDFQAIRNAGRIFRGASLHGGSPFTKDIAYLKGFVMIHNFISASIKNGNVEFIPFLFAGKSTLEDLPVLFEYHKEGVVSLPKYLPAQFQNLNKTEMIATFSKYLNQLNFNEVLENINLDKNHSQKKVA